MLSEPRPGSGPEPGRPNVPVVRRLVVFPSKPAKICGMGTQPIQTVAGGAFAMQHSDREGRGTDTRRADNTGIGCKRAQHLRCYADQPIPTPNSRKRRRTDAERVHGGSGAGPTLVYRVFARGPRRKWAGPRHSRSPPESG